MNDIEIKQELQSELVEKEEILWAGQPRKGIIFSKSDIIVIPLSLLWLGIALAALINQWVINGVSFFTLYIGLFAIAGLYIVVGRFFYNSKRREKIMYAITPTRIIIKSTFIAEKFNIYEIASLPDIVLFDRGYGSGTIVLTTYSFYYYRIAQGISAYKVPPMLEYINDAKNVYDLLLRLKNQGL